MQRVLNYAVNGIGVGHITRLLAINKALRELAAAGVSRKIDQVFLTTSEASSMLNRDRFPCYKILSPDWRFAQPDCDQRMRELGRRISLDVIQTYQPDLLIVDTFPNGAFGELRKARESCRRMVLIHRRVKETVAKQPYRLRALEVYDTILMPYQSIDASFGIPNHLMNRVICTGPVLYGDLNETMSRADARSLLGVGPEQIVVYVTAGGGGDPDAERCLKFVSETLLQFSQIVVVVGAGLLSPRITGPAPRIRNLPTIFMTDVVKGFDFAVSAAGFNTFNELMYFKVPTIFFAQHRNADDQKERALEAAEHGAALYVRDISSELELISACGKIMRKSERSKMRSAAARITPTNNAAQAAAVLLGELERA